MYLEDDVLSKTESPLPLNQRGYCKLIAIILKTFKYWLVFSGASLTSWGEGVSLTLVRKMLYGVDVLHRLASHPIFSYWVGFN